MNNETKGIQKRNAEYVRMVNRKQKLDQWISDYWYERYTRYIRTDRLFWENSVLNLAKMEINHTMKNHARTGGIYPLTTAQCMTDYLITQVRGGLANALREWNLLSHYAKENLVVYFVRQYKKKFYTEVTGKIMPGSEKPEIVVHYTAETLFKLHGFPLKEHKTAEDIIADLEHMAKSIRDMHKKPEEPKPTEKLTCEVLQEFLSNYGITRWTLQIDGPREAIYKEGMF
jgi:hypothetical protein